MSYMCTYVFNLYGHIIHICQSHIRTYLTFPEGVTLLHINCEVICHDLINGHNLTKLSNVTGYGTYPIKYWYPMLM